MQIAMRAAGNTHQHATNAHTTAASMRARHQRTGPTLSPASKQARQPVTAAIWVILWTSVMVGYAGGYSDAAGLVSHASQPYRQLFFPSFITAANAQAWQHRSRFVSPNFTGLSWDAVCLQGTWQPPVLVQTFQILAQILALPFAAWLTRMHGRKAAVILGCCLQALGVILKALSWHLAQLLVGYGLEGLGRGILWLAVAIEDAEIAPANIRGGFMSCNLLGATLGFISAVAVFWHPGLQRTAYGWRVATAMNALPATVVVLLLPWFSESPNSLIQRGQLAEGREALLQLRGQWYDPNPEVMDILEGAGGQASLLNCSTGTGTPQSMSLSMAWLGCAGGTGGAGGTGSCASASKAWSKQQVNALQQRQHSVPLFACAVLVLLLSVVPSELAVAPMLVGNMFFQAPSVLFSCLFLGAGCQVAAALAVLLLVDWVGRRWLLAASGVIGAACWAAFAGLAAVGSADSGFSALPSAATSLLLLSFVSFAHYLGPFMLLPILATEYHRLMVRTSATALLLFAHFCIRLVVINTIQRVLCGLHWWLFVLVAAAYCSVVLVALLLLPETKRVQLERVQHVWQQHWLWRRWLAAAPVVAQDGCITSCSGHMQDMHDEYAEEGVSS